MRYDATVGKPGLNFSRELVANLMRVFDRHAGIDHQMQVDEACRARSAGAEFMI